MGEALKAVAPKEGVSEWQRSVSTIEITMLRSVAVSREGAVVSVQTDAGSGARAVLKGIADANPPGK